MVKRQPWNALKCCGSKNSMLEHGTREEEGKNTRLSSGWVLGSGLSRRIPPAERLSGEKGSVDGWWMVWL